MMRTNCIFLLLLSLCPVLSCNNKQATTNKEENKTNPETNTQHLVFDKLVGTWQSEDGKSFERWSKNTNGTYQSVAYSIKGKDTSWNEQASIYPENGNWIFENTVKGQNDGKAIKFTSSQLSISHVRFSNPGHDFPTDIHYAVADRNKLNAFIVGPNDKGGKDTIPFNFTRLNQ